MHPNVYTIHDKWSHIQVTLSDKFRIHYSNGETCNNEYTNTINNIKTKYGISCVKLTKIEHIQTHLTLVFLKVMFVDLLKQLNTNCFQKKQTNLS